MPSLRQTACYRNGDVGKSGNTFRLVLPTSRVSNCCGSRDDCVQAVLPSD